MEFLLIVVLLVSSHTCSTANDICNRSADEIQPWQRPYLPQPIQPVSYGLVLTPDFYYNASSFTGSINIEFKVINATNTIILLQKNLGITETYFSGTTCAQMPEVARSFKYNDYWVIQTNETMEASNCTSRLYLRFHGNLTDARRGTFRSTSGFFKTNYFNNITGKESWLVATYFVGGARVVFPCFDVAIFKVPFRVTLIHWRNFTALSNMNVKNSTDYSDGVWKITTFENSPAMSSDMVAFFISDFAFKENNLSSGKPNRMWARPDRLDKVDYALNVTAIVDNYFLREFDLAHSLEKLDHFALPLFSLDGVMNWGLLAYKDWKILVDVKKDGYAAQSRALEMISHEMAHTYFAGLVSCPIYDHNWLCEGMATFYEAKAMAEIDPTLFDKKKHDHADYAMRVEAKNTTYALVTDTAKYSPMILYYKGAALTGMVESFMGPANFKSGIRRYLRDNLHKHADTSNFWAALQPDFNDSSLNLEEVMKTWCYEEGFPVVSVLPLPDNHFVAIQERFLSNRQAVQDCRWTWHVPLKYRTKGGSDGLVWVKDTYAIFNVSLNSPGDWIQFNYDANGYYIVNYDDTLLERIVSQLKEDHTIFSESARLQLFRDASKLVNDGHIGYDRFFSLTKYASEERSVAPWNSIISFIDKIKEKITHTASFSLFQRYILNLTSSFMDELEVKDEGTDAYRILRPNFMSLPCSAGHRECIKNTSKMFKEWIKNRTTPVIPVPFKMLVYCIGVANSVLESEWNTVYERFVAELTDHYERHWLRNALTCSRNATILKRLMEYAIQDTRLEWIDRYAAFENIAANPASEDCLFEWLQRNYSNDTDAEIEARKFWSGDMISAVAENVVTREKRDKVLDFLNQYQFTDQGSIQNYRGKMDGKIDWMDKNLQSIATWLEHNVVNN